jgi:hypothetical protein
MVFLRLPRTVILSAVLALVMMAGVAFATEFLGACNDCCGETVCDDCVFCWCCNAVPVTIEPVNSLPSIPYQAEKLAIPADQYRESHSFELLDPPPRS